MWLVTWESFHPADQNRLSGKDVVTFFDARKSLSSVKDHMWAIYAALADLTWRERLQRSTSSSLKSRLDLSDFGNVVIGDGPFLFGRIVRNLEIRSSGEDTIISWIELRRTLDRSTMTILEKPIPLQKKLSGKA